MNDPTIVCPNCRTSILQTESLAAPLIEATRKRYKGLLTDKDRNIAARESVLSAQQEKLDKQRTEIDALVAQNVRRTRMDRV